MCDTVGQAKLCPSRAQAHSHMPPPGEMPKVPFYEIVGLNYHEGKQRTGGIAVADPSEFVLPHTLSSRAELEEGREGGPRTGRCQVGLEQEGYSTHAHLLFFFWFCF